MPEKCETLEELRWTPGLADCDLKMYLRAARSMAAFAGMCDGGSAEDGCLAASRDDTTINALQLLHESNYDTGKALQALVKSPVPKGIEKKWTEEEQKRFVKGLRLYGKNFFKIRKELLSHKETPDLVEYYYLWKKTPQAASARPHRRHRRCVLRRIRKDSSNSTNNNPNSQSKVGVNNKEEASSASEEEVEQTDDSDSNTNTDLTCSNCGTLAKELHQTGTDRSLLCHECRSYMKKHGKHRPVDEKEAKAGKGEDDSNLSNGKPNLRTRKNKEKGSKAELIRGNSKSSETSSPDGNEINLIESSSNSSEAKPTNGSAITNESELKRSEIPKKRHFSNLDKTDSTNEDGATMASDNGKEGDSEAKRKKLSNETGNDEKSDEEIETIKEETATDDQIVKSHGSTAEVREDEVIVEKESEPVKTEPVVKEETEVDGKPECSVKEESNLSKVNSEQENDSATADAENTELEKMDIDSMRPESGNDIGGDSKEIEESPEQQQENAVERTLDDSATAADGEIKEKVDTNLLANMKVEPPSSPKSPQDLSTSREKRSETNVPSTSSQTSTFSTVTNSSSFAASPAIKKEDNSATAAALNFSASAASKVSPSSSPSNPMLFPFSQNFPQIPSSLGTPTSMTDRYPYLMPQLSFPPGVAMNPDVISSSPKLSSATNEKPEGEHRLKEEPKSSESRDSSKRSSTPSNKSGENAARNLASPKTISSTAPTFPPLASPFTSTPSDPFLMSNPNFAPPHLASPGERLPFPNPLINYPPGFSPHLPGLPPFMNPWSQYATAARLPPGAFPSPYLPPSASPISSHSPHSQISKSKSPITSQSSSHHSSPSHFSSLKTHENKDNFERRDRDVYQQEEDDMDNTYLSRGPSPEPKIEDSECHRSQSAIFLRHWNRGDYNSCARTDLTFKPVPDSQLSRKREERARKAAEKEREDHKQKSSEKSSAPLDLKPSVNHGPPQQSSSSHDSSHLMSPLGGRHTPRNFDTPALRQLSEYARPHSTYSPFSHPQMAHHMAPSNMTPLGLHGPNPTGASPIDQMALAAQYQMLKDAEEKQKLALLEKQKELEMKSRSAASSQHNNASLPPTSSASSLFDQHLMEMQRRFAGTSQALSNSPTITNNPSVSSANGMPLAQGGQLNPFMSMFPPNDRAAQEMQQMAAAMAMQTDRYNAERFAMDPLIRLQMSLNPELANAASAHSFQHHLHSVHQAAQQASANANAENAAATMQLASAAAAMGLPGSQFDPALHASHSLLQSSSYPSRPPSIMPRPELAAQQASLFRSFEDQLSHQLSAQAAMQHEQLQRQMIERERIMHLAAASQHIPNAHAFQTQALQEEYLRQRDREMKMRGFDDVARNGRPPM